MDRSEETVRDLLESMGFSNIVYEPDGNVPPDFLVDGRIAIEVRRLNQNYDSGQGVQGLEQVEIPLWHRIEKLVKAMQNDQPISESWFVFIDFSRPLHSWKELKPKIKAALVKFQKQHRRSNCELFSQGNLRIELVKASKPLETYFCMGGISDEQSGGLIVAEMLTNLELCMSEKNVKTAGYRDKYPEW